MSGKTSSESPARHRALVLARVVLAAVGGYLLASLAVIVLASLLSEFAVPRAGALLTATLWSFVFYAGAVLYVFAARSVRRAALVLAGAGAALAAVQAGLRLLPT